MPVATFDTVRLDTLQSFKEVTWNTGAAATAKWMGLRPRASFKPKVKADQFEEQRGTLAPAYLSAVLMNGGEWKVPMYGTYEDINFALHAAVQGNPTITGAGPYVYPYAAPLGAAWDAKSYTLEYGSSIGIIKANGCVAQKLSISGEASKEWQMELSGFYGTHTQSSTLTAALADRTVEVALMPSTALYMDASGGTIGTTAFACTMLSFGLDIDTGLKPVYAGGSLIPCGFTYDQYKVTLKLGLLYTSALKTFLTTTMLTGGTSLIRLKSTSGTKIAQLDFAGVLTEDPEMFPDKDNARYVEVSLSGQYDSGFANYFKASVTNGVATLP